MSTFTFKLRDFLPLLALVCVLYAKSGWLKLACSEEIGSFCPLSCRQAFFFLFFSVFSLLVLAPWSLSVKTVEEAVLATMI